MARKQPKTWVYSPAKPTVPKDIKAEVETKAREFIKAELKPKHLKPPPKDADFTT